MSLRKVYSLVPPTRRRRLPRVLLSALCSAVVDLVGIAALVSILLLVLDENIISTNPIIGGIYNSLGFASEGQFIGAVCLVVLLLIGLKAVAGVALGQYRARYMMELFADLSQAMYQNYLSRGLLFVRSHHTTTLINNVNAVCHRFAHGIVSTLMMILTEAVVVVVLLAALASYNALVVALIVAVFLPVGLLYSRVIRRRMAENGKEENRLQVSQNKTMFEALRGYADIEIAGAKPYITERFEKGIRNLRHCTLRAMLMRAMSSYVIEFSLVLGVVAVIIIGLASGHTVGSLKVFLGVFAVAAYRIIPSVSRITSAWTEYKRNLYVVDVLSDELSHPVQPTSLSDEKLPFDSAIELGNITFGYGQERVLDAFSLTIRKGEKVGIRGASGRGKTTLFNIVAGLFEPAEGSVKVDGVAIEGAELRRKWQNNIAYVSQDLYIPDISIAENVAFGVAPDKIDRQRLNDAIDKARLRELVDSLANGADTVTGEGGCRLSGGQRQRIGIARALYKEASVLMLDEATSSLDEATERDIVEAVERLSQSNQSLTILFISHNPKTLSFCDRIVEL
ncbi:MAG: ABC transporter ATP-binding protein [Tidjanibacter sp.]|nr:ABC transporter ATP-binding protein [Tidjanibacter sp.]